MPRRDRIAVLLACAALLAAPATALAQSGAGDQQYQDPFAGQQQSGSGGSSGSSGGSGLSQSAPSGAGTAQAAPAGGAAPAAGASTAQGAQLARTGIDLRILAGVGLVLLAAGVALRRSGHARR